MKPSSQNFLAALLLSSLLPSFSATAQTQPPVSYKLIAVTVTGSKRFTQQEIAAASGLPLGTIAHEEDFKKAARQLGETLRKTIEKLHLRNSESVASDYVTASVVAITGRVKRTVDSMHLLTHALAKLRDVTGAGGDRVLALTI